MKLLACLPRWKEYSKQSDRWLCCIFIVLRLLGRGEELREEVSRNLVRVSEVPSLAFEVALFHWQNRQFRLASTWIALCIIRWPENEPFKSLLVDLILEEFENDLSFESKVINIEDLSDSGVRGILYSLNDDHDASAQCILDSFHQNQIRDIECLLSAWAVLVPLPDLPYFERIHAEKNHRQESFLVCAILAFRAELSIFEKLLDNVVPGGLNARCLITAITFFGDRTTYESIRPFIFCYIVSPDAKKFGLDRCMRFAKQARDQMLISSLNAHHLNSNLP